jgi:hypothetical protein
MITVSSSFDILGVIFAQGYVLAPLAILSLLTASQFNSVYSALLLAIAAALALQLGCSPCLVLADRQKQLCS